VRHKDAFGEVLQEGWGALPVDEQKNKGWQKVVGTKETIKALETGEAHQVFIASDAEYRVIRPVVALCEAKNIEPEYVDTMLQLGKMFGIKVKAATAATKEY